MDRKETVFERQVRIPDAGGDLDRARDLMAQLRISGEIERTVLRPDNGRFEFRVVRAGTITDVKTDLEAGTATVEQIEVNI